MMQAIQNTMSVKLAALSAALLMPAMASAALTISLSNGTAADIISPAAGQTLNIISTATGTDATAGIKGLDIYLQVANGGVNNGNTTNPLVPKITNINLIPSTGIFAADNAGGNEGLTISSNNLLGYDGISTNTNTTVQVPVNGVLGTVTFDATGIAPGVYNVYFGNVGTNSAQFGDGSDSDYVNASGASPTFSGAFGDPTYLPDVLTVAAVPEPTTALVLMSAAGVALLGRRRPAAR